MNIHDKLAARIHAFADTLRAKPFAEEKLAATYVSDVARAFAEGDFDDILGVREPTIDDVRREATRVSGREDAIVKDWGYSVVVRIIDSSDSGKAPDSVSVPLCVEAPTIASAYAALRALPDWKGDE